ncbi:efflux RND transporter permease subunit [Candidatus Sororendozoicomonas aggregata]|uniref:efflux RND transporter permease subunit n=1 Tax=Candidatus Sororendozoicomonas aggregata TaxID=3073239 RepID=UPI002ED381A9
MILSDVSVKRPVLAIVISLLLVTFGSVTFLKLPLREMPDTTKPKVSIRTSYSGASAEVVESRITTPIEEQLSGIEGIEFIESNTANGSSRISIEFDKSRNIDSAANDVRESIARVIKNLPEDADEPIVSKSSASEDPVLYVMLRSKTMSPLALTDYANRTLKDRLSLVSGVSSVDIMGERQYVMRVELNLRAMASRNITAQDIDSALKKNNIELPGGEIDGKQRVLQLRLRRDYNTAEDFKQLILRHNSGDTVYLKDVAHVFPGAKESKKLFKANGFNTVGLAIVPLSQANPLSVIKAIKKDIKAFAPFLPEGTEVSWTYDASTFIQSAINEVYSTLGMTMILVVLVIYIFLGNVRSALIPAVTIPISLIAAFIAIHVLDYSINLLTLLALVMAIGLVVDDAIVVLENVHRHLENGETPLVAAYKGTREVGFAVIATTLVLIVTFVPIAFLGGSVGRLFSEYALTLAGAVFFSSIIALTLSPMMASKLLKTRAKPTRSGRRLDNVIAWLENTYSRVLQVSLKHKWLGIGCLLVSFAVTAALFPLIPQTFAPKEDNGAIFIRVKGPEGASFNAMSQSMEEIEKRLLPFLNDGEIRNITLISPGFGSSGTSSGFAIVNLKDWKQRDHNAFAIAARLRNVMASIPNVSIFPVIPSSVGGRSESPVQYVVGGGSFEQVKGWADTLVKAARQNPSLVDIDTDYSETQPQLDVIIDKVRAAKVGVSTETIGTTLNILLNGKTSTSFVQHGEQYDVFLTSAEGEFLSPGDISQLYVRSDTTGQLIRLDTLVTTREVGKAANLPHYNRNRSITISANLVGNYSLGDALGFLDQQAIKQLPPQAIIDYKGESRKYHRNQSAIYSIFALAIFVVFLVLAAQFESFVHPFIVIMTVPLGLAGALSGLLITGETINIYSQLAMIMLIGLTTKNGILIVEFANQLRDKGLPFETAIFEGARLRLRPILMTALTTVAGSIPLLSASGAGAESRFTMGVVVFFGVATASLLTLFVVPSVYALLARKTSSPEAVTRTLQRQLEEGRG